VPKKAPKEPYPPDVADDAQPVRTFGVELLDVHVVDVDWSNERAARLAARRAELRGARLTGIDLAEATLIDVAFADCRIDLANLRYARLERVVFRDCPMGEIDLYGASLTDVLFERCDLRQAAFDGATAARLELRGCVLDGLRGVEALRGARMPWHDVLQNAALFAQALEIEILAE
jgi:uncharacterized protein YjbI with pentapeptide repeats